MDRLAPRQRPARRAQGTQRWHRLLFSHWEIPEAVLRPLVPARLTLDTFEGRCFVGVVPFTMQHVRPLAWAPPMPTAREFHEINLRTYVHVDGDEPGVFFFSLDADSTLAVLGARAMLQLPYHRARYEHEDDGTRVRWRAERRWPSPRAKPFEARFEVGGALPAPGPDSLEFFLVERYELYTELGGRLLRVRVHHSPYALQAARVEALGTSLLEARGLSAGPRTPDYFSPGVDVEVFAPELVR